MHFLLLPVHVQQFLVIKNMSSYLTNLKKVLIQKLNPHETGQWLQLVLFISIVDSNNREVY